MAGEEKGKGGGDGRGNLIPPERDRAQGREPEPSYYDVPMLKAPLWKWDVAGYFFFGGMSAGSFVLGRVAERFGGPAYRDLARAAAKVAMAAALPCAPLLIHDLGDPRRFHHMLRMWKPSSPMNLGTWTVTAFSGAAALNLLREWAVGRSPGERTTLGQIANWIRRSDARIVAVTDVAGIPLGLLLAGYTGVLLSNTSNPLWSLNAWLGPLFSASAIGTGAAATSLALAATGSPPDAPSRRALETVETAAHFAKALTLAGFLRHAGPLAAPLTSGRMRRHLWLSGAALALCELLKHLPFRGRPRRLAGLLAPVLGLASGFFLRWAFVYGGHESAADPRAARRASATSRPSADGPARGAS